MKINKINELLTSIFNSLDKFDLIFYEKQRIKILEQREIEEIIKEMSNQLYEPSIKIIKKDNKFYILDGINIVFNLYLYYLGYKLEKKWIEINKKTIEKMKTNSLSEFLETKFLETKLINNNQKKYIEKIKNQKIKTESYYYENPKEFYSIIEFQVDHKINSINLKHLKEIIFENKIGGKL